MHTHFMEHYGDYLKSHYSDLDKMSQRDLCEAKMIAKTMKEIFEADKIYNIIKGMEEGHNQNEMEWDEFYERFSMMYKNADATEKTTMKAEIMKLLS